MLVTHYSRLESVELRVLMGTGDCLVDYRWLRVNFSRPKVDFKPTKVDYSRLGSFICTTKLRALSSVLGVVWLRVEGKILAGKCPLLPSVLRPGSPARLCPLWLVLWIRNFFLSGSGPIFLRVLDPDPTWLLKSSGSSSGSDHNIHSFTMIRNFKVFSSFLCILFKENDKLHSAYVIIIKLLIILMISDKI
jgi:hypothetical protein